MKNEPIPYDQLEGYLQGDLEGEELAAFQERLSRDEALQQELALYRQVRGAAADDDLDQFESVFDAAFTTYKKTEQSDETAPSSRRKWVIGGLLILLVTLLAGWLLFHYFAASKTPEKIYAQFAHHEFAFQEMGPDHELAALQNLLNKGAFSAALPELEAYLSKNPARPDILLAKGICLLETDQIHAATQEFANICQQYPLYRNEAVWYLALAYLKDHQLAESIHALSYIAEDSSRYPEAQQLIQAITKIYSGALAPGSPIEVCK